MGPHVLLPWPRLGWFPLAVCRPSARRQPRHFSKFAMGGGSRHCRALLQPGHLACRRWYRTHCRYLGLCDRVYLDIPTRRRVSSRLRGSGEGALRCGVEPSDLGPLLLAAKRNLHQLPDAVPTPARGERFLARKVRFYLVHCGGPTAWSLARTARVSSGLYGSAACLARG